MNTSRSKVVSWLCKQFQTSGTVTIKVDLDRHRAWASAQNRHFAFSTLRHRRSTAPQFALASKRRIYGQTLQRMSCMPGTGLIQQERQNTVELKTSVVHTI
ncbi:hypothetical protein TNCV_2158301 [Trichonephila clavipes]|nr:hypothetical protein TNCV_2158301 [Trichonephila clavipes]